MRENNPIRVATAALSERIFAGRPTKDGRGFKEPRYDVTSDVLVAIRDKVGVGNEIDVSQGGGPVEFRIVVLPPGEPRSLALDARTLRLVVAARRVAFGEFSLVENPANFEAAIRELDEASEAFAEEVTWDDMPAHPSTNGDRNG